MSSSNEPPSCEGANIALRNHQLSGLRRQGMRTSMFEASNSIVHVTLTAPAFLTGYLLMNGASDLQLTVLLSLPYFLMVFQIGAAYLASLIGRRRELCALGLIGFRGVHAVLALLPFVPGISTSERLWIIFVLLAMSHLSFMLLANTWWMWMADLVPERIRGRYFGFRSAVTLVLGTVWSLAGGALLDYFKAKGDTQFGFCILFCVASAFALVGLLFLWRQYEPPMRKEPVPSIRQVLSILGNSNFRRATIFLFTWNFGMGLMSFLSGKHMLGYMGMSFQQVMLYPVIVNLIGFACAKSWGRLMDHVGTRSTLILCGVITGSVPLLWLFTAPGVMWPIWFDAVAAGIFMTGLNIAALNLPLVVTPKPNRLYYLALFATITGLGIGLASVLAGKVAMMMSGVQIIVPGLDHPLVNYHLIFACSSFFRMGSVCLLLKYREDRGKSVSHAIGRITSSLRLPVRRRRVLLPG